MKLKYRFVVREIMGEYAVLPSGESALAFSGMVMTNAVGASLWTALQEETTQEELVQRLLDEFEVDRQTAETDVCEFIENLKNLDLLSQTPDDPRKMC